MSEALSASGSLNGGPVACAYGECKARFWTHNELENHRKAWHPPMDGPPQMRKWVSSGEPASLVLDLLTESQQEIVRECDALRDMLLEKNAAYGNSALDPLRVFSKADPVEQILVRLDDKLSRLKRGASAGEDVEKDIMGYLILLRIARRRTAK